MLRAGSCNRRSFLHILSYCSVNPTKTSWIPYLKLTFMPCIKIAWIYIKHKDRQFFSANHNTLPYPSGRSKKIFVAPTISNHAVNLFFSRCENELILRRKKPPRMYVQRCCCYYCGVLLLLCMHRISFALKLAHDNNV